MPVATETATDAKLVVRDLYKIFGPQPERAYRLLEQGLSKQQIFEQTGLSVGVQAASFEIYAGEIFVIMGLSGSGKSTLVRLLNRLIEPTSGQVLLDGQDVASLPAKALREIRRNRMSMVFQSFALMPHYTVIDNAAFGLELAGVDAGERQRRALEALRQVGLEANADSYPDELSGGMQQRVGLARALAVEPEVMLMDEAFSALDPLIRTEMQDELVRLQAQSPRTVVFISHDLDEAMRIGDRIAIMEGGRMVQIGTPDEILHAPANDYVRSFFKGVNVGHVYSAGDIARRQQVTVINRHADGGPRAALQILKDQDRDYGYVIDRERRFVGVVSVDSLRASMERSASVQQALLDAPAAVPASTSLQDIIGIVAESPCAVPVVGEQGEYRGVISKSVLLGTLSQEQGA